MSDAMSDAPFPPAVYVAPEIPFSEVTRTLQFKVKPEAWPWLDQAGREVNQVWNWASDTSRTAVRNRGTPVWLSEFDLNKLSAGAGECFARIGSDVIQRVNHEFATRRNQAGKTHLKFRRSGGSKKSLGWVPFKAANLRLVAKPIGDVPKLARKRKAETQEQWEARKAKHETALKTLPHKYSVTFLGKTFRLFQIERLFQAKEAGAVLRSGNFAQNSLGEWFLNITITENVVHIEALNGPDSSEGLDPGLKDATLTSSTGESSTMESWDLGHAYRNMEPKIQQAQKRGHKKKAKRLNLKVKNQRTDAQYKTVKLLVDRSQQIFIGNAPCVLVNRGKLAKAGYDHAWGLLRTRLKNSGHRAGRRVEIVNEKYTTSTCSRCGRRHGPTGRDMLIVRKWSCPECVVTHHRDHNAAENIRKVGLGTFSTISPSRHGTAVCGNESLVPPTPLSPA